MRKQQDPIIRIVVVLAALAWVSAVLPLCALISFNERNTEIHKAIQRNDLEKIKALLKADPEAVNMKDEKDEEGVSPLQWAAAWSKREAAELLLVNGASVNGKSRSGVSALHEAVTHRNKELAELLLKHKADINIRDAEGRTPLYWAVLDYGRQGGHEILDKVMLEFLLSKGADLNAKDANGATSLQMAARNDGDRIYLPRTIEWGLRRVPTIEDRRKLIALLLAPQWKAEVGGAGDAAKLFISSYLGNTTELKATLESNAKLVHAKDNLGQAPLHIAVQLGFGDAVELLLAKGANVDAADDKGMTALHFAIQLKFKDLVKLLLAHGARVDVANKEGATPLHLAIITHKKEIVEIILAQRPDVNAKRNDGRTPLYLVAEYWNYEKAKDAERFIRIFLERGANTEAQDDRGWTSLHAVVRNSSRGSGKKVVELLLTAQTNVNARDKHGRTPTHLAVYQEDKEVLAMLLANGANPNLRDQEGSAPLQSARDAEIIGLLRKHGAKGIVGLSPSEEMRKAVRDGDVESVNKILKNNPEMGNAVFESINRWTILHEAVTEGRSEIVQTLLENQADPNAANTTGETPLHWAVRKGHVAIAKLLLEAKADPNLADAKQRSPLHEAAFRGQKEIVELLLAAKADVNVKDAKGKSPLFYAIDGEHKDVAELLRKVGAKE